MTKGSSLSPFSPQIVASLLGHEQVELALRCLGSLLRYSAEPLRLRLHDDGSLTESDGSNLRAALQEPEIVSREEADDQIKRLLEHYPNALRFRREHPLALKLLDIPLLYPDSVFAYCDTDVLFLRPFKGLFALPLWLDAVAMEDNQNAYSLRSWHLLRHPRLKLPRRLNSGILMFRKTQLDLDRIDWYLEHPEFRFAPMWVEQTAWALLAGTQSTATYARRQVRIPKSARDARGHTVALHFVQSIRGSLDDWSAGLQVDRDVPPVQIETCRARRCGPLDLFATELARWARRSLSRFRR